ncbi:MAG: hypothetical protein R6X23_14935 [Acidimicrobiia bacterium]
MTIDDVQVRLRTKLESAFGAEEASYLMDRPPGGWSDLVTNQVLEARLDALRSDLVGEMSALRADVTGQMAELRAEMARGFQVQTWRLVGTMLVAFGLFATLVRLG